MDATSSATATPRNVYSKNIQDKANIFMNLFTIRAVWKFDLPFFDDGYC